jgi:hypothetical protein
MGFKQPDEADNPLTPEEDLIHQRALEAMRAEVAQGRTFVQASSLLADINEGLRQLVKNDFLKITIAEEHFSKGISIEQVGVFLGLSAAELAVIRDEMLEEVGMEMARQYRAELARTAH